MRLFKRGDRVKLDGSLLRYSANKEWIGKQGTVLGQSGSYLNIKWDHLDRPQLQPIACIEHVRWNLDTV